MERETENIPEEATMSLAELNARLKTIDNPQRDIVCRYLTGYTLQEIASALSLPLNTVQQHLAVTIQVLKHPTDR